MYQTTEKPALSQVVSKPLTTAASPAAASPSHPQNAWFKFGQFISTAFEDIQKLGFGFGEIAAPIVSIAAGPAGLEKLGAVLQGLAAASLVQGEVTQVVDSVTDPADATGSGSETTTEPETPVAEGVTSEHNIVSGASIPNAQS